MYYIYKTTNLINGKTYIGQHKFDLGKNDSYIGSGKLLWKAIKKYGKENFKKEILEVALSKFEVNILEKYYIAKERAIGKAEYNLADGGLGGNLSGENHPLYGKPSYWRGKNLSPEHCKKISENNAHYWKGKHHSPETCQKISEANSGEKHPFYGKHHTEESNEKNRQSHLGRETWMKGKHHTEEANEKNRQAHLGRRLSPETRKKVSENSAKPKMAKEYKEYKANGGILKWNEWQKEYKRHSFEINR